MQANEQKRKLNELEIKARQELEGIEMVQAVTLIQLTEAYIDGLEELRKMTARIEECLNFQRSLFESRKGKK